MWPQKVGPTEIRTRVVGFKVQSDSHYTIGPRDDGVAQLLAEKGWVDRSGWEIGYSANRGGNLIIVSPDEILKGVD